MNHKIKKRGSYVMKIVLLVIAIILIIFCLFYKNNLANFVNNSEVKIIENKSFLSDFEVIKNEVHIYCVVSLENNSSETKKIKLVGNFENEVENGLLISNNLEAHFIEADSNVINIEGTSNINYLKIEFVGECAGGSVMSSRSLPQIDIIEE